jgi:TctA family transporter
MFSRGDFMTFLTRPISGTIFALTVAILIWGVVQTLRARRSLALA